MKAGILDLSFSIPVFLIVVLLSVVGFSVWSRYSRNLGISSTEGEIVDRFQFVLGHVGYIDPCSGNAYPIINLSLTTRTHFTFYIDSINAGEPDYLFLFPIFLFLDNGFRLAFIGVGEDAGFFIGY